MQTHSLKKSSLFILIALLQLSALLFYLNANIVNVGEMGTALPVLALYVALSGMLILLMWLQRGLYLRTHLLLFLLLIAWIAVRVVLDLGDMEYLKQITIATTGGMLFFYLLGAMLGITYTTLLQPLNKTRFNYFVLLLFIGLMLWMLYNFSQRLHPKLFYLLGVDGSYQRPGNFLSISFITVSFLYLQLVIRRIHQAASVLSGMFWLTLYTLSTLMALVASQLFGSNSATAVVLGVYLITLVMTLLIPRKSIWMRYLQQKLALPWSKRLVKQLVMMTGLGVLLFMVVLVAVISVTGFDITSMRVLGFGSGENTSLVSRADILASTAASQLGYAPILGNINVAYLTTGDAGRTLHSFFPYVVANLGLVGLVIVLLLFFSVLTQLYRESKRKVGSSLYAYQLNMTALYSIFVFLYLLFFANLATGVSWAVLWFTLGFISKPFGFSERF